jgi:hypothetical protein
MLKMAPIRGDPWPAMYKQPVRSLVGLDLEPATGRTERANRGADLVVECSLMRWGEADTDSAVARLVGRNDQRGAAVRAESDVDLVCQPGILPAQHKLVRDVDARPLCGSLAHVHLLEALGVGPREWQK